MQYAILIVAGSAVGLLLRRMVFLRRCGCLIPARRLYRRAAWTLGGLIWAAMLTQEALLLASGLLSWRTGLPLHLCSLMGLITLPALVGQNRTLWQMTVYLGMPGALMALLFPSVVETPWPQWTALSFHTMHALVFLAPLLPMGLGWRPDVRGAVRAWLALAVLGLAVLAVNALVGGNYLFLGWPVEGTPLTALAARGLTGYRLALTGICTGVIALEGLAAWLAQRRRSNVKNG
ncbi:MAG: TIGR02206 family membrane protein [Aristaeellaceae bacterium]